VSVKRSQEIDGQRIPNGKRMANRTDGSATQFVSVKVSVSMDGSKLSAKSAQGVSEHLTTASNPQHTRVQRKQTTFSNPQHTRVQRKQTTYSNPPNNTSSKKGNHNSNPHIRQLR
jgi:hypothetical protein